MYYFIYIVTVNLMEVHTCIILVSMYLRTLNLMWKSTHVLFYLHCYSEFNGSPHMYYFSLYVSTLNLMEVHTCIILSTLLQ